MSDNFQALETQNIQNTEIKKTKKSKKSKKTKKFSFKRFLKDAMKSKRTEQEKIEIHKQKIQDSLGGGQFQKIDVI